MKNLTIFSFKFHTLSAFSSPQKIAIFCLAFLIMAFSSLANKVKFASANKSGAVPEEFLGDWFRTDGANEWVIGIHDSIIIFNNNIWQLKRVEVKRNSIALNLESGETQKKLYLKKQGKSYLVGEGSRNLQQISKTRYKAHGNNNVSEDLENAVFKKDSAVYKGYFRGYSPTSGSSTGMVYVNNIIKGEQENYLITIHPDGSFYAKFPMNYPEDVFIGFTGSLKEFAGCTFSVYCEPGKELFQAFDLSRLDPNYELKMPYSLFMGELATMNEELAATRDLKFFKGITNGTDSYTKILAKQLRLLDNVSDSLMLSRKAYSRLKSDIKFSVARTLLGNKLNTEVLSSSDSVYIVNFIKDLSINDAANVMSTEFKSFLNRLQYAKIRETEEWPLQQIKKELQQNIAFSEQASEALDRVSYPEQYIAFYDEHPLYQAEISFISNEYVWMQRIEKLKQIFNLQDGLALEIMRTQNYLQLLNYFFVPYSQKTLLQLKKYIRDPFLYNALVAQSEQIRLTIEANSHKTDFIVNQTTSTKPDNLFYEILNKFKGKVVYIDFWATWCGPCLEGIARIAPVKEEMANENIAFVYITNHTSPIKTYDNRIPAIKGEHYRLSADEWNYISGKYKIAGLPRYMLVDKQGQVVNADMAEMDNMQLKAKFRELLNE